MKIQDFNKQELDVLHERLLKLQQKSMAEKLKVSAIIFTVNKDNKYTIIGEGINHNTNGFSRCEDKINPMKTLATVIHAEISAINSIYDRLKNGIISPEDLNGELSIMLTYPPCINCAIALSDFKIKNIIINENRFQFTSATSYGPSPQYFLINKKINIFFNSNANK